MDDDDNDLPLSIIHARDSIIVDDEMEQDYRYLVYRFAGDIVARAYLDDMNEVAILAPREDGAVPGTVMRYFQRRFQTIRQLGGPQGYRTIWRAD